MSDTERTAYPLAWPVGRPRTKAPTRAHFKKGGRPLELSPALRRLLPELERLGASRVVVSTNVPVRLDGLPRAGARPPTDVGVAVYFDLEGQQHCLACDRWDRLADNVAAIAAHVEAVRGQLRWGVGDVMQAFAGHKALPPVEATRPWWVTLGFRSPPSDYRTVREGFRSLARVHHPDAGGNVEQWHEITAAVEAAERELGVG